ncbi:MAG: MFS transporter [Candidatus Binatia bacterium]
MGTRRKLRWVALLYFAEGLPFGIVVDTLPVYLRTQGASLAAIGDLMGLVKAPWTFKPLWAPLVDRLGSRRRWISGALGMLAAALALISLLPAAPVGTALTLALLGFTVAAATQDIAIDAYTIEILEPGEEGRANGIRVSAYRAALIVGGGLLLMVAGRIGWPAAFLATATVLATIAIRVRSLPLTAVRPQALPDWLRALGDWLTRPGTPALFLFVVVYKLGDQAMGPMVKPFWVDRGLTLDDIALVSTTLGVAASVLGALVGGWFTSRWGILRGLWVLGLLQAASNLGYAAAAWSDAGRPGIYAASLGESFTGGLGTAAFLAFLMNVCDKRQAATQYAVLSALFSFAGMAVSPFSGRGVAALGYARYFALTAALALPAYALLPWVRQWIREEPNPTP